MKKEMIEITPDGKQELVPGKEPLKKKPKKATTLDDIKKSISTRWEAISKALDSSTAFMPMMEDDEKEPEQEGAQPEDQSAPEGGDPQQEAPEQGADQAEMSADAGEDQGEEEQPEDHSQLEEELKNAGYSEAEIAHIVHGHVIPAPDVDEAKYNSEVMDGQINAKTKMDEAEQNKSMKEQESKLAHEHSQRMNDVAFQDAQEKKGKNKLDLDHHSRMLDLEYEKTKGDTSGEHQKKLSDLEVEAAKAQHEDIKIDQEHKKKMLALEYENAKKEKDLELQFRMKEHEMKLKLMEEGQKHKVVEQKEKHKMNLANAKTQNAAKKKMKKSDEEDEDDLFKNNEGYVPNIEDIEEDERKIREAASRKPKKDDSSVAKIDNNKLGNMGQISGLPMGWSYNPSTRNLNHSMHGAITVAPHSKDAKQYSVRHNGGEYGKFSDVNQAAAAAVNRAKGYK